MYKFTDKEEISVNNLETGQRDISPGFWLWDQYQEWLGEGNTTEPYKTQEESDYDAERDLLLADLSVRVAELEEVKSAEGLNDLTIAEARAWISNKMDRPGTVQEKLEDIKSILLKMVPYILEYKI